MEYRVTIRRLNISEAVIEVEAETESEAEDLALGQVSDYDFEDTGLQEGCDEVQSAEEA